VLWFIFPNNRVQFAIIAVGLIVYLLAGCRKVFKFTHRLKINIFAPHGRLFTPIHVKFM